MSNPQQESVFQSFLVRMAAARVLVLFVFHAAVFAGCYAFAWLLRFEFTVPAEYIETFKFSFPVVIGVQLIIGVFFGFYRGWWRYVGMADVVRLVIGLTTGLVVLVGGWYVGDLLGLNPRYVRSPRGVLLIDWAFALLSLFGARAVIRLGRDRFRGNETIEGLKRVLIVGAGDAGETLAREIEHRPQLGMKVVGFVDDERAKWGSVIRGIKVTGPISEIGKLADAAVADEALIAIPSASGKRVREVIHHLSAADLKFKTMPGIDQLVSGKVHATQLRPVNVEDLLRRQRIDLPGDPVRALFKRKRVLITGAGGSIGSELASQVLGFGPAHVTLVERSEHALYQVGRRLDKEHPWARSSLTPALADIRDAAALEEILRTANPEIVLHAAAHKHVPLGEQNPAEYLHNNCVATFKFAELCRGSAVQRFVFISTDKAINPTSVMGATKRAAEISLLDLVRETSMKVTIVRFGNVIGSSGSVIPLFMEQIASGGPVTVTHPEMTRYFLRISEAVSLVLQAATLGDGGNILMLDMGEPVKIADLARDLIQLSNHTEEEIPIVYSGIRPGEKLYEEIRLSGESVRPTLHPQIVITEQKQPAYVGHWLQNVQREAIRNNDEALKALRALIPEYARGDSDGVASVETIAETTTLHRPQPARQS